MLKYAIAVAAILSLVGGIYYAGHSAGFDERDKSVQGEISNAVETEKARSAAEWQVLLDAAQAEIVVEERIVEKIREVEIEVPKVVERIVEVRPECRDLGPDYGGLLDQQVAAANGRESPADPAALAD